MDETEENGKENRGQGTHKEISITENLPKKQKVVEAQVVKICVFV